MFSHETFIDLARALEPAGHAPPLWIALGQQVGPLMVHKSQDRTRSG
jgi:hypothetical protein